MSLINEALKKAQRQRAEGVESPDAAAADAGATPGPRVARREKPAGFRSQIMMAAVGGVAVLVVALAAGGFWWWRSGQKAAVPPPKQEVAVARPTVPTPAVVTPALAPHPSPTETKPAPTPTPVVEAPKPATTTAAATKADNAQFTLPLAPAPAATQTAPPAPAALAVALPVTTPAATVAVPQAAERPKPSMHMITVIENLRVEGIRAAGTDSKVLMNDRVYRLNDVVDHEIGFRLTGVTDKSLTFEDDRGAVYTRNF